MANVGRVYIEIQVVNQQSADEIAEVLDELLEIHESAPWHDLADKVERLKNALKCVPVSPVAD